ncbi:hypothetical protein LNKW23_14910 [Paralimibaculum aggregatum]|uniref:Cell wall hydrolase SleB domain-containing protein n=1 Tax=Paralimibaculum aggregatum TaxID=3036245 RepID=A0ABQ6LG26_9RHOB|nr:cell wall hydrolase [Limibaculum sp. NKW23]GMG82278.1 hypothetical protein LNKW23_14910 [Limibaculum sp. NKW23]
MRGLRLRRLGGVLAALAALAGPAAAEDELDGTRPLDTPLVCLARAVYFEARGRSLLEMTAVAHVVLNRRADEPWPDSICAVIRDGGEAPPCQFSWWCDGRPDTARDRAEYDRAVAVARRVLAGRTEDPTDGANMFHNLSARPAWARVAEPRGRIGAHYFYHLPDG